MFVLKLNNFCIPESSKRLQNSETAPGFYN